MSPPAKRRKLDLPEEFKVVVGVKETQKTFTVAKQFLTKSSDFFRKACNGDWRESQNKTINLPEGTPEVFSVYLQWLYTGELVPSDIDGPPAVDLEASKEYARDQYTAGIELYVFGDSIMDIPLQNSAMDFLRAATRICTFGPGVMAAQLATKSTVAGCSLRRFLVDYICKVAKADFFQRSDYQDHVPLEFCIELLSAYANARVAGAVLTHPRDASRCHYHVHNDDNPKCE